jgi:aldose 1-epimerase
VDIVVSALDLEGLCYDTAYMGATVGRVCNRIRQGELNSPEDGRIQLSTNEGVNQLHGGFRGFDKQFWKTCDQSAGPEGVRLGLQYLSQDGEEGFPGAVLIESTYSLNARGELRVEYQSHSLDRLTPINVTQHVYWNLGGSDTGSIVATHSFQSPCDRVLETDAAALPTGKILSLDHHRLDFRMGKDLGPLDPETGWPSINDFLILDRSDSPDQLTEIARIQHKASQRCLRVCTDQPGFQLYTGTYLPKPFSPFQGLCVETSGYIDAPHHRHFPSIWAPAGTLRRQTTVFQLLNG